jgi:NAD(P)H-nitrite reductase large subunit
MAGTPLFDSCKREGVVDDEAWLLGDRDLAYERHFSRDGLDAAKDAVAELQGADQVPSAVLQYLALKTNLPVCRCHAVGEEEMRCAIRSGATTLKQIRECTGAVSGCGACASIIHSFLRVIVPPGDWPAFAAREDEILQSQ